MDQHRMDCIRHYDALIEENNDPVQDPALLRAYMDKWDGQELIDLMQLAPRKTVLEIGVGTGRLALRVAPLCQVLVGVDISPKTAVRAAENAREYSNVEIVCADFTEYQTEKRFDVIYSSLTFLHIEDKKRAIEQVASMLKREGRFVLSIEKRQGDILDFGTRKIKVFPDQPETISAYLEQAGMKLIAQCETEFAHLLVATSK